MKITKFAILTALVIITAIAMLVLAITYDGGIFVAGFLAAMFFFPLSLARLMVEIQYN